jgi:Ca2+-transporting ATPase
MPSGVVVPDTADKFDYRFLGLVGFADPLRDNVSAAVAECRTAGIRIIMITGDFPATAQSIAMQAGLDFQTVITGDDIKKLDEKELQNAVKTTHIFARISPDQKLRIVQALKANGEVVAMTGDGVNDAPSLKAAHIGVAMGLRGTDVAREASSIVLLDDNFASLVHTIALGRRIYDNLRKAMVYIVAVHVPIAGLALLPLIFDKPLILTPLLIALMEMVIDPACSVVLEAEQAERNVMKRPPRNPSSPLLTSSAILWGVTQGVAALVILGAMWVIANQKGMSEKEIRSLIFVSLIIINFSLILINRSFSASIFKIFKHKNPILGWGALGIAILFSVILFNPFAKGLFNLGDVHFHDVVFALLAGIISMVILEWMKPLFRNRAFN